MTEDDIEILKKVVEHHRKLAKINYEFARLAGESLDEKAYDEEIHWGSWGGCHDIWANTIESLIPKPYVAPLHAPAESDAFRRASGQ